MRKRDRGFFANRSPRRTQPQRILVRTRNTENG